MNIPQKIKDYGGVAAALAAIWLIVDKVEIPDWVEPATVEYVNDKTNPLELGNKNDAKNWALRNIPFHWDKICTGKVLGANRDAAYAAIDEEYKSYEWATNGSVHRYSTMSKADVCLERADN